MKNKKKKKKQSNLLFILIFLLGFLILAYPHISNFYYKIESNNIVNYFDKEKGKLSKEEIDRRFELAEAFNKSLINNIDDDPYDDKVEIKEGRAEYARMLEIKEYIGHVEIPKIREDVPIYAGTSEEVLQKGAGHLEGTSLPIGGENSHTVITAHTGLPSKKLFTDLDKLKEGDIFYIHNFKDILAYKVNQIKVVEPSKFDDLLVVKDKDYATLLTCTPYMINTHRLLVRGERVPYVKEDHEANKIGYNNIFVTYFIYWMALLVTIILSIYIIKRKKKNEKKEKEAK